MELAASVSQPGNWRAYEAGCPHSKRSGVEPAICCQGVAKTFESGGSRVHALRGIDLEILPGAITLLVGPSGCGKTTLISILAGLLNPSEGSLRSPG